LPKTECLADVVERAHPYFMQNIVNDCMLESARGGAVLVVAHGNSLRAIRMILENISQDEIAELEIPTGIPYRYLLNDDFSIREAGYLGDPEAAAAAASAVAKQAG